MAIICPTVLAADADDFKRQIERVAHLSNRLQIDLTDGDFAKNDTIKPEEVWWPVGVKADIHLMFKDPKPAIEVLVPHQPNLIIVHAELAADLEELAQYCREKQVNFGVALLPQTGVEAVARVVQKIDHGLIFSGDLGSYGGHADLTLLEKANELKKRNPDIEVGWDGGINPQNVSELVFGGVDVLNVGGFIQNSDDPEKAYGSLMRIAEETGTT